MGEEKKVMRSAKISITFGVLGLILSLFYGGVLGIVGLVYGACVLIYKLEGRYLAIIGMITSAAAIGITSLVVLVGCTLIRTGLYNDLNEIVNSGTVTQEQYEEFQQKVYDKLETELMAE